MPSERTHLRGAQSNEELAKQLLESTLSPSWVVVVAFYSALHWVDAFLARSAVHPDTHTERDRYVHRTQLRLIYDPYRTLADASRQARYTLWTYDRADAEAMVLDELGAVRRHVEALLSL